MPSPESTGTTDQDDALERMLQTARRITAGSLKHKHDLTRRVVRHHDKVAQKVNQKKTAGIGSPPAELVRAMRSPVGRQQLVVTYIHGRKVRTVINPLGMRDPDRESDVWECLVGLVTGLAKELAA